MPMIMTLVCIIGIMGLFLLDPNTEPRPSLALWIPVGWLFLNCSRPASTWMWIFGLGSAPNGTGEAYIEGSPIDAIAFTVLLIAGLVVLFNRSQKMGFYLRKMGPMLVFFTYCLISIAWSSYPFVAFKHWNKGIGDLVMALVVVTDPQPFAAMKRLFVRIGFVLIPLSILFIKYYPVIGRSYGEGGAGQYQGAAIQKNGLGMICILFGFGSLWRIIEVLRDKQLEGRNKILAAHFTILGMIFWLLKTSDAMTSLSCFLMGSAIMIALTFPPITKTPVIVHVMVWSMIGISVFAVFFDSSGSLLQTVGRNATLTGRTAIWQALIPFAGNPMVGTGYESFWLGDRLQAFWTVQGGAFRQIQEAHNGYIELFLNLGWVGIALLAVVLLTGYRKIFATFKENAYAGSLGLAFFVAEVVYSITEAGFRMMFPLWVMFLLASLGVPKAPVLQTAPVEAEITDIPADNRPRRFALAQKPSPSFAMQGKPSPALETGRGSTPFRSKRNDF